MAGKVWDGNAWKPVTIRGSEKYKRPRIWDGVKWDTTSDSPVVPGQRGEQLPLSYNIGDLQGTTIYMATDGNDVNGGSVNSPVRTLQRAVNLVPAGGNIVIRGGVYPISSEVQIGKNNVTITAYPGEIPIFDGTQLASTDTVVEGDLVHVSYTTIPSVLSSQTFYDCPRALSSGVPTAIGEDRGWVNCPTSTTYENTTSTGLSNNNARVITGYYADQVYVDGQRLIQVHWKSKVGPGKFWVDRSQVNDNQAVSTRLYLHSSDAADMSKVRVSTSSGYFINFGNFSSNITLRGIKFYGHAANMGASTVVIGKGSVGHLLEDLSFENCSMRALWIFGGATSGTPNLNEDIVINRITIDNASWHGAAIVYTNNTQVKNSVFKNCNPHWEYNFSPQSGGIKATKNHDMLLENCLFSQNVGHAIWWDQSNYNCIAAGNDFLYNEGASIFYEISHGLVMVDNYTIMTNTSNVAYRLVGSSGLKVVNNTAIGGQVPMSITVDPRSREFVPGVSCANHYDRSGSQVGYSFVSDCWPGYTSDLDMYRDASQTPLLDWMPEILVFVNNVMSNPSGGTGPCGSNIPLCIKTYDDFGNTAGPFDEPLLVDPNLIVPSNVVFDGNLYNRSGTFAQVRTADDAGYVSAGQGAGIVASDITSWRNYMGQKFKPGIDSVAVSGPNLVDASGNVTGVSHENAYPVPVDADINQWIAAGTKHFGVTRR